MNNREAGQHMKRTKSLAVVAGFAMVTLAACGGDGGGGNAGGNSPSEFINPESDFGKVADAEGPAPEVEGATTGGTITVAIRTSISTVSPDGGCAFSISTPAAALHR